MKLKWLSGFLKIWRTFHPWETLLLSNNNFWLVRNYSHPNELNGGGKRQNLRQIWNFASQNRCFFVWRKVANFRKIKFWWTWAAKILKTSYFFKMRLFELLLHKFNAHGMHADGMHVARRTILKLNSMRPRALQIYSSGLKSICGTSLPWILPFYVPICIFEWTGKSKRLFDGWLELGIHAS
jgi:hypothetical protein